MDILHRIKGLQDGLHDLRYGCNFSDEESVNQLIERCIQDVDAIKDDYINGLDDGK